MDAIFHITHTQPLEDFQPNRPQGQKCENMLYFRSLLIFIFVLYILVPGNKIKIANHLQTQI